MVVPDTTRESTGVEELRGLIERIEQLEGEKATLVAEHRKFAADIRAAGYDPGIIERIVRLRRSDSTRLPDQEYFLDLYSQAVSISVLESWF